MMGGTCVKCNHCGHLRPRDMEGCPRCSATEGEVLNMPYDVQCSFCKGWRSGVDTECPTCGAGEVEDGEPYRDLDDSPYFCVRGGVSLRQEWNDTGYYYDGLMLEAPVYQLPVITQEDVDQVRREAAWKPLTSTDGSYPLTWKLSDWIWEKVLDPILDVFMP